MSIFSRQYQLYCIIIFTWSTMYFRWSSCQNKWPSSGLDRQVLVWPVLVNN